MIKKTSIALTVAISLITMGCAQPLKVSSGETEVKWAGGVFRASNKKATITPKGDQDFFTKTKGKGGSAGDQELLTFSSAASGAGAGALATVTVGVLASLLGDSLATVKDNGIPEGMVSFAVLANDCSGMCPMGLLYQYPMREMAEWKAGEPLVWDKLSDGVHFLRMKRGLTASIPAVANN
ncbi:MAG: hypothetical protein NT086_17670 [Proteobacteria bacterium]|nr:hypothetical protein [Pseudomonadota bacterium]